MGCEEASSLPHYFIHHFYKVRFICETLLNYFDFDDIIDYLDSIDLFFSNLKRYTT